MQRTLLFALLLAGTTQQATAQCSETDVHRVLLVGDSWAFFMGVDGTINELFAKWGHSNFTYYTNATLAENGAETDDFQGAAKQAEIQARIDANPSIDVVHLSLGGNDVLGDWNVDFTAEQTDSLKAAVEARLLEVIAFAQQTRPGMRVLWSGYMYPNFGEVISELGILQTIHPFHGTWEGMGFPNFEQLNTILNDFSATVGTHAAGDPQLDFVNATGLMQHTFGQNTPLGVAPGGSYPPLTAPLPAGYVDYPSPRNAMRNYGLFLDCFHLSAAGYRDMVDHQMRKFYHKFLMSDQYLLGVAGAAEGHVGSSGTIGSTLRLGEENGEQLAALVSFNTPAMTGTNLEAASLFLRREALTGTNPIGGTVQVAVNNGYFGASATVEADDFNAAADGSGTACRFGSNTGNGHWIRLDLPAELLPWISDQDLTQFRITAPGATGGVVTFTGSADPELAPVLNLTYADLTTATTHAEPGPDVVLYPNPTDGLLHLDRVHEVITGATVFDPSGRVVLQPAVSGTVVDLGSLPPGIYLVELRMASHSAHHRIVKW